MVLQHNLLIIYRNFKRFKTTFYINIIGLSTGLACTLLIYLWVNDEMQVDKFHEKDSRLYQVMENQQLEDGIKTSDATSGVLAESLIKDIPEIEYAATVTPVSWFPKVTLSYDEKNIRAAGEFTTPDFFNIFTYKLIEGNRNQVLSDNKSIVISETMAKKLFNTTANVVGKTISWKWQNFNIQYQISGIFQSNPLSSSQFDFLLPFAWMKDNFPFLIEWGNYGPNTFVVVRNGADINQLNKKLAVYMKGKLPEANRILFAKRFSDLYLHGKFENGVEAGGRIEYVKLFSIIAIIILVIACANFMNLSTAKASKRMKEVGLKKTIGATRTSLILQYFGESVLLSYISLIVAIVLVLLLLPQFNHITGKQIPFRLNWSLVFIYLGSALLTGVIAGSYPAIYLSGFKPARVLRGMSKSSLGELWVRKGLVIFQFVISVVLIVCVLVTYNQIKFIQHQNLGYEKDNIIYFEKEGKVAQHPDAFLAGIKNIPGVINASSIAQSIVSTDMANTMGVEWPGKQPNEKVQFYNMDVYYGLIETLGIQMKEGRSFSKDYGAEDSKIIFNEAAIKTMGIKDPVGKVIKLWGKDMQIIGVTRNFYFQSIHQAVKPFFLRLAPDNLMNVMVKISGTRQKETLGRLQSFYESYNPGYIFDFRFLDDDYEALYVSEKRVATLAWYFSLLAILISCLGLFGLAAFTAERRFKEIGIRKTLGSSDMDIILLLSKDFTRTVVIAIVIGLPLSFFMTKNWLNDFQYRIHLGVWYFVGAGLITLIITWLTVGLQAFKAARINTVQCLRD
jgi:ABC-type antimicrobial peptide transport system permease subunit